MTAPLLMKIPATSSCALIEILHQSGIDAVYQDGGNPNGSDDDREEIVCRQGKASIQVAAVPDRVGASSGDADPYCGRPR